MSNEPIEERIQRSLAQLRSESDRVLQDRAVAAMASARLAPARSRFRWAAIATTAVVALIGLGFVPIPLGSAKGALDRALAQAENARTVHIVGRTLLKGWGLGWRTEQWLSEDGFRCLQSWNREGGCGISLAVPPWDISYGIDQSGQGTDAEAYYDPCSLQPLHMPDRAEFLRRFEFMRWEARTHDFQAPDFRFREYRKASLWGGDVIVVEAEMTVNAGQSEHSGGIYESGDVILYEAEIDPGTDALLSTREFKLENGDYRLANEAEYEWNVEIPEELRRVDLPPGRRLTRHIWWESRADQVIAQGHTRDWEVTLHAIDVNRRGDVLLSLGRMATPEGRPLIFNSGPAFRVEAVASGGGRYTQLHTFTCYNARHAGYWTTTLVPESSASYPYSITLTIWPYDADPNRDQSVTFRGIPLPPRQDLPENPAAAAVEVIQY